MKFSDLLGDPEPESRAEVPAPAADAEPISVFAPEPVTPPVTAARPPASTVSRWADNVVPPTGMSGLAELNVRQPVAGTVPGAIADPDASVSDLLTGLTEIDDDLLPGVRRSRK
jgi:hypothetical protein